MAKNSGFRPGETVPRSGQWLQRGPRGGEGKEVTLPKGKTFPPTPTPGGSYDLADATKNKSGKP